MHATLADPVTFETLPAGLIRTAPYETLLASPAFAELETMSDAFRAKHQAVLARYARRWVSDPLRQWSRRWEYPFVLGRLAAHAEPPARVLDAGSGLTFFPAALVARGAAGHVECCDSDPMVRDSFARFPDAVREQVGFRLGTLQELPWEDGSFDALYCVSVLEHTGDYGRVLAEFARVLKPGAPLVLTFDISPDGRSDVPPEGAQRLLDELDARFERVDPPAQPLAGELGAKDLLTTSYARATRPDTVPWRRTLRSDLYTLAHLRLPRTQFYELAVFCGSWRKAPVDR